MIHCSDWSDWSIVTRCQEIPSRPALGCGCRSQWMPSQCASMAIVCSNLQKAPKLEKPLALSRHATIPSWISGFLHLPCPTSCSFAKPS
jgi:hypothetical protein